MASVEENVSDMRALENATTTIIQQFSPFETIKIKNSREVSKRIDEVEEQRLRFQEFVSESIIQSNKLSKCAEDFIFFSKCCANNEFSEDYLLELLRRLLNDANENKKEAEKLQLKIRNIIDDLTNINNKLVIHSKDIGENERLLDSETKKKLVQKEADKNRDIKSAISNAFNVALRIGISLITVYLSHEKTEAYSSYSSAVAIFGQGGFEAVVGTLKTLGTIFKAKYEISTLDKDLKEERDQLTDDIKKLNRDFIAISDNCREFLNFWQNKTNEIKDLIEKLKLFDDEKGEFRNNEMISGNLFDKWQRVNKNCEDYNSLALPLVGNNRLLTIE